MATTITREATWNKVGTDIREANSVKEALQISGLDYEVVKAPIYLSMVIESRISSLPRKRGPMRFSELLVRIIPSFRMKKLFLLLMVLFRKVLHSLRLAKLLI